MKLLDAGYYVKEPRIIEIEKDQKYQRPIDYKEYVKRTAVDSDYDELIRENLIVTRGGKPVLVYLVIPDMPSIDMVKILKHMRYMDGKRTSGLKTKSRIFGFSPREKIRKDYCSSTSLAFEDPKAHDYICKFGASVADYYRRYCPEMFLKHMNLTKEKVLDEWTIRGSPFTSGVINKNNPLKYHFDSGNFEQVYSNMVAFRKDCRGGHLAVPEFNIGLEIGNKSLVFFDGQAIVHGVTPFRLTTQEGYRFTIVYYTLKGMWRCEPVNEEVARIKQLKTERERLRYKLLTGEKLTLEEQDKIDILEKKSAEVTGVGTTSKSKRDRLYEDFITFSESHLASWDIDPTYPLLKHYYDIRELTEEQRFWFTHLFVAFYNVGSAEHVFSFYHDPEIISKECDNLVCNLERRGFRGRDVAELYLNPTYEYIRENWGNFTVWILESIEHEDTPQKRWTRLRKEFEKIKGNGTWASYKWCDLLKYVHGFDGWRKDYPEITAPDIGLGGGGSTAGPVPGLALITGKTPKEVSTDFKFQLSEYDHVLKQGLKYKGPEQFETALCDFNSMYNGHYYIGHDIDKQFDDLMQVKASKPMWDARNNSFSKQYLGEKNNWTGVRKELKTIYRDTGEIVNQCMT